MSTQLEEIEEQVRSLTQQEKAALAHTLIEELDSSIDADAEQLWIQEAQRRYDAYLRGEIAALPGEEVMKRARERLR